MKEIPLSAQGKHRGRFVAIVDDGDYEAISKHKWIVHQPRGNTVYAARRDPATNEYLFMHRVIANAPKGLKVDHIDGSGLNNVRSNLRLCTHAENLQHRKKQASAKASRYKGVWKCGRRWSSSVQANGTTHYLGTFATEIEAAQAYDKCARELHGRFAVTNF